MKLKDYDLHIGVIVNVNDPDKQNKVQCAISNIQDVRDESFDEDTMLWARPFCMNGWQSFSKAQKNMKVWILQNTKNRDECWYINFFEYTDSMAQFIDDKYDEHPEVVFLRKNPDGDVKITYDDIDGIMLYNKGTYINVKDDGTVSIGNANGGITINGTDILVGSNTSESEPTVLSSKLIDIMENISKKFSNIAEKCLTNRNLVSLAKDFTDVSLMTSENNTQQIKANNTNVT